ncbi:MAG: hypothetical protein H7A01_16145 [Hahellaceae bacterium]|nr:hypothetical protein [Hahellaceae bacterium]MCP5210587.1 hypothetical protein [Hahellaceae bacterium]
MNFKHKELIITPLITLLAACGGSGGFDTGSGTDPGDGDGEGGDGGTTISLALGVLETANGNTAFSKGTMRLDIPSLSAGGQTTTSVNIVNEIDNTLYETASTVSFTSNCVQQGLATITGSVTTSTGTAQALYTASGCVGSDTITSSLGDGRTAVANLIVAPAEFGELAFTEADPTSIGLKNLSNPALRNVSEVKFQLLDKTKNPLKGEKVLFTLNTQQGASDATLTNSFDTTNSEGIARAFVSGGSEKGTVRVIATVDSDTALSTQSGVITITTGIATQRSLSLSLSAFNPFSWGLDGITVDATARVSDFYNNPVADGTKVIFDASHGQIQAECEIVDGACSVTWRSQSPKPTALDLIDWYGGTDFAIPGDAAGASAMLGLFLKDDDGLTVSDYVGKVSIMASVKGEEATGPDHNANGLYDTSEKYTALPEAYNDYFANGQFEPGDDYRDWNNNGAFDVLPSDTFRGARCSSEAKAVGHCAGLADLFDINYLDMSAHVLSSGIMFFPGDLVTGTNVSTVSLGLGEGASLSLLIQDFNGNSPGTGTSISVETDAAEDFTIDLFSSDALTVTEFHRGPIIMGLSFALTEISPTAVSGSVAGSVKVTVTNPDGSEAITNLSITLR